jgi:hypothetical protein
MIMTYYNTRSYRILTVYNSLPHNPKLQNVLHIKFKKFRSVYRRKYMSSPNRIVLLSKVKKSKVFPVLD